MTIDTTHLRRCILALDKAYDALGQYNQEQIEFEIYRSAVIKEFEIVLEQSGNLLKKALRPYLHSNKEADKLVFKDVFRKGGLHGLLEIEEVQRWLEYRDNRNLTSHDYGEDLANKTLILIKQFIADAQSLADGIEYHAN